MRARDWWMAAGSSALGVLFFALLIRTGKLNFNATLREVRNAGGAPLAALVLLTFIHIFLSSYKWQCVDAALRGSSDSVPSRTVSFGMTAIGVALGQVLPIQLGVATARTIGAHFYGKGLKRGTAGSFYEQGFDVVVFSLVAVASCLTLLLRGGAAAWTLISVALIGGSVAMAGPVLRIVHKIAPTKAKLGSWRSRVCRGIAGICDSGLLQTTLVRKLILISAARFVILALMAGESSAALGVHIALWHLAAATPMVTLACVIILTPGGIGVNELSYATILHLFGTPLMIAAQWAFANRILVTGSCFLTAAFAVILMCGERLMVHGKRYAVRTTDFGTVRR